MAEGQPQVDVLLSYAPGERVFARDLGARLTRLGFRVGDRRDPKQGAPTFEALVGILGKGGLGPTYEEDQTAARRSGAKILRVVLPGGRWSVPKDAEGIDLRNVEDIDAAVSRVATALRGDEPRGQQLSVSSSVASVGRRLTEPVPAAAVIWELFNLHPEYGRGRGKAVRVGERPSDRRLTIDDWLREIRLLFEVEASPELHGRLVIIGLFLLEPPLVDRVEPPGTFDMVVSEFTPPLEQVLTPHGHELWERRGAGPPDGPGPPPPPPPPPPTPGERREESVPVHTDNAAIVDELQRDGFARTLATRIRAMRAQEDAAAKQAGREHGEAFLIHLDGPWGSGKTSVLNFLRTHLGQWAKDPPDGELRPWVVITFNAWRHQRIVPPWWWLMIAVEREGGRALKNIRGSDVYWRAFRRSVLRWHLSRMLPWMLPALLIVFVVVALLVLIVYALSASAEETERWVKIGGGIITALVALVGVVGVLMRAVRSWSARGARAYMQQARDPMQLAKEHFAQLIDWLEYPVAVFIDDLDRCKGENVVELLEGIQTLLREVPVTYVVAADREWLSESYADEYEAFSSLGNEPGRPFGYRFLEKTFQVSAPVPNVSQETLNTFWGGLIEPAAHDGKEKLEVEREHARVEFEGLDAVTATRRLKEDPGADAVTRQARAEAVAMKHASPAAQRETEHALRPFAGLLDGNPRLLKRLVNAYGVTRDIEILAGRNLECDEDEQQLTALWTVVELRWPELAKHLARKPEHVAYVGKRPVPFEVPRDLRPLFTDAEVERVVAGNADKINVNLDAEAIKKCCGHTGRAAPVS